MNLKLGDFVHALYDSKPQKVSIVGMQLHDGKTFYTVSNALDSKPEDTFYVYLDGENVSQFVFDCVEDALLKGVDLKSAESLCFDTQSIFKNMDLSSRNIVELKSDLACMLMTCRVHLDETVEGLTKKSGISAQKLHNWESAKANPRLEEIATVAGKLGITLKLSYTPLEE